MKPLTIKNYDDFSRLNKTLRRKICPNCKGITVHIESGYKNLYRCMRCDKTSISKFDFYLRFLGLIFCLGVFGAMFLIVVMDNLSLPKDSALVFLIASYFYIFLVGAIVIKFLYDYK
jgi:hypothetical protein